MCFASETGGSWNHVVIPMPAGGYCTNCGNGSTVPLPEWAIKSIREQASWVGKRYYPADEDREAQAERSALLALVTAFPGRAAEPDKLTPGRWMVFQAGPKFTTSTSVEAASADEAMRKSGLRYFPGEPA